MRLTDDPRLEDLPPAEQRDFTRNMRCPSCGRKSGQKCLGMNGNRAPVELEYCHRARVTKAAEQYRLYIAQKRNGGRRVTGPA